TVYVFGEDIDKSVLGATQGLFDEFGEHRVRNTPISEQAVIGSLIGAALTGMRPVFDVMFGSFFYVALSSPLIVFCPWAFIFIPRAILALCFVVVLFLHSVQGID
ncbi:MAG: hypothetical protein EB015_15810, partial [Methylocystaceae bacterium]|nr:hypothetical protein [Methylocystaceae bacterium]